MKKIYNCQTGKMVIKESSNMPKRGKLYESFTIDDILDNARAELHNETELKKVVFSPNPKPIAVWEYRGTRTAQDIVNLFNDAGIDIAYVSGKTLATANADFSLDDSWYNDEKFVLIDDFTFGRIGDVEELIEDAANIDEVAIILVGKIDSDNSELLSSEALSLLANFVYTPYYDRQTAVIDDDEAYESVAEKFAKYRKLYESEDDDSSDEDSSDDSSSDEDEAEDKKGDEGSDDEETEDVPMTAIVLTVKKDDVDKCKEELVDAGIPEDAITEVDTEEDDENGKLKVDADYALELKDYLKGKGIDLEEKIGGEIIDDSTDDSDKGGDEEKKKDDEEASEEGGDFDAEFGDLFGEE